MDKFNLKSWCIGIEVPFFDVETDISELSQSITESYLNWFDAVNSDLTIVRLANGNHLVICTIIIRIDNDLLNDQFKSEWESMKTQIENHVTDFMSSITSEFKIIKEREI